MSRRKEEIVAMKNVLKPVANSITSNMNLLTKADLLESFNNWKSNFEEKKVVLSWRKKMSMPIPEAQVIDDCWAIALSKAIGIYIELHGIDKIPPTPEEIYNGVPEECILPNGAIDDMENVIPYLKSEGFLGEGKTMKIHYRPHVDATQEEHENFERCLVHLLSKGPVVVGYDMWHTFQSYEGIGIYISTELDQEMINHEVFEKHISLLTGLGAEVHNGQLVEFWELNDSRGKILEMMKDTSDLVVTKKYSQWFMNWSTNWRSVWFLQVTYIDHKRRENVQSRCNAY